MKDTFKDFVASLESQNLDISTEGLTEEDHVIISSVYESVNDFLTENNLIPGDLLNSMESFQKPITALSDDISLADIGVDPIMDLCQKVGIPNDYAPLAAEQVALMIYKYSDGDIRATHFTNGNNSQNIDGDIEHVSLDSMFSTEAFSSNIMDINSSYRMSTEAFGVSIDHTYLDARTAIVVTLLEFHKGIINRLLPTRAIDGDVVPFKVDRFEIYDLEKASSTSAADRYKGNHRTPFIDLYSNPSPANTTPKKIIPLETNDDSNDYVLQDGYINLNTEANLFDLSVISGLIGYSHVDYTDLVSDGAKISKLMLKVTDGTDTEYIPIDVSHFGGARFVSQINSPDSADRMASIDGVAALDNNAVRSNGTSTALLNFLNDNNHYVSVDMNFTAKLNLKTSYFKPTGSINTTLKTKDGSTPLSAMNTSYGNLTFSLQAAAPDCYYNEENIRKTTSALRIMTQVRTYPIPGSKSVVVDYSLMQNTPETVINALSELLSIGNDARAIDLITDVIDSVYTRLQEEAANPTLLDNYTGRVMNEFVAGHVSLPSIFKDTFDASTVVNFQSSNIWGDLRVNFEKYLVEVITYLMNTSKYYTQLTTGEAVTFNVLTSGYIKDALMSVPMVINSLEQGTVKNPGDRSDFKRVLPNGTELNVITTDFDSMADRIIMLPVRPSKPRDVLNFGTNVDKGNFVATVTPVTNNAAFKRIVANAREIPIVTNPLAAVINVTKLSEVFDTIGGLGV